MPIAIAAIHHPRMPHVIIALSPLIHTLRRHQVQHASWCPLAAAEAHGAGAAAGAAAAGDTAVVPLIAVCSLSTTASGRW